MSAPRENAAAVEAAAGAVADTAVVGAAVAAVATEEAVGAAAAVDSAAAVAAASAETAAGETATKITDRKHDVRSTKLERSSKHENGISSSNFPTGMRCFEFSFFCAFVLVSDFRLLISCFFSFRSARACGCKMYTVSSC